MLLIFECKSNNHILLYHFILYILKVNYWSTRGNTYKMISYNKTRGVFLKDFLPKDVYNSSILITCTYGF